MKMSVKDIRNNLADAINRVAYAGEHIVLTRKGKGVAALVSMEEVKALERFEDEADLQSSSPHKGRNETQRRKAHCLFRGKAPLGDEVAHGCQIPRGVFTGCRASTSKVARNRSRPHHGRDGSLGGKSSPFWREETQRRAWNLPRASRGLPDTL